MSKRIRIEFPDDPDLRHCITLALKHTGQRVSEARVRREMTTAYDMHGMGVLSWIGEYCESVFNLSEDWDIE